MGLSTAERFGQISSDEELYKVKHLLDRGKYSAEDLVFHKAAKVTGSSSGIIVDISTVMDPDEEADPLVAAGYDAVVLLFLDRQSSAKLEVDYCGTSDGSAYSQTATFGSSVMTGMMLMTWTVCAENYENNCKFKLRPNSSSSSYVMHYQLIILMQHNGKAIS